MRSGFDSTEFVDVFGFDIQHFGDTGALLLQDPGPSSGQTGQLVSQVATATSVELFDSTNTSQGTFATIQEAVDAAGSVAGAVTIVVDDGTYNENVVIDRSDVTLLSVNGRGSTTIMGVNAGGELGAIEIDPGANNVTIGGVGQGFTIVGINGNGAVEKAAVYLQGSVSDITILDNEIVANGDAGLLSEFSATVSNVLIDGNEFSGQTFDGAQPGGEGFSTQFDVGNDVPRQLVTLGGGNGGGNTSNITFSNNLVSGTAGGISEDTGNPQGNTLVTIDAAMSSIVNNEFTGDTARFATAIRARGPETDIIDNTLSGESRGIFVANQGQPGTYSGNVFNGTAIDDVVFSMTEGNDVLNGGNGDDGFGADAGNDAYDGGAGTDQVGYAGTRGDFSITQNPDGSYTITDTNTADGDNGSDTLTGVEGVSFSGTQAPSTDPIVFELDANSPDFSGALERFANDFETDTDGLIDFGGTATLEASNSNGIPSANGASHVRLSESDAGGVFSRLGGYRSSDTQGFTTSVDIYLDTNLAAGEGFDFAVAANGQDGNHLRDFIFHVTKDTSTGELLVGGSNNTNFDPREDLDTINHAVIDTSGWYTFEHEFYENADGNLEVAMNVYDSDGNWVFTEVRSDPGDNFATDFGGNRYAWFTNIDVVGGIAIDDLSLSTLDTNPVQVFDGTTIIGTFASVADAQAALADGDIVADTAFIETTGQDDGFFFVVEGMSVQAAIDAASPGDTVQVAAGTYTENLTVDEAITLVGANGGTSGTDEGRGAESIIDGTVVVTASATLDGFEFLNDTAAPASFFGVRLQGANDVSVTNSVFFSAVANGADGDRAIYADTTATGNISITNNLFTGASEGKYSTASWERGIWSDGAAAQLDITGNTFSWARTAMNLDGYDDATHNISNNTLTNGGSGISIGIPKTTVITGINNNTFTNVDTDFNIQNPTVGQEFDLVATNNTGGGTGLDALIALLATQGDDVIRGSAGDDFLRGNNGTDTLVLTDGGGSAYDPSAFDFSGLTFDNGMVAGTLVGPDGTDILETFEIFEVTNVDAEGNSSFIVLDGMDLQAALNAAGDDDTIILEDGTVLDNQGEEVLEEIEGGRGTDDVVGTDGNDLIDTSGGNDTVDGGAGNDDIIGGSGGDTMFGNDGNDEIDGGSGNDVIGGGDGADILTGGSGRDTFVVEAGKTAADADIITDFRSTDRIALADADGRDIVIQQNGSDTEILADGVLVVTLLGVRANRVTNLVEYDGTPASIDAPAGRGRNRFRDEFDFDSFNFGDDDDMAMVMPTTLGGSMSTQVSFESVFGSANTVTPSVDGQDSNPMDGNANMWLLHGVTAMDDIA